MHLGAPFAKTKSFEDFFLAHYDWLIKWALQLSHGQQDRATDLVHDLYVQFLRSRSTLNFGDEDRSRGYLYTMLRHLSVSKARREGQDALSSLLIVDFESVEYGFGCIDRSKLVLVRSDLARICEYACIRRHSSRSAGVLILRFFLGYYPSEIVSILKTTPAAVEKHLHYARQEARMYMEQPGKLRFLGQDVTPTQKFSTYLPEEPSALFAELRARIFASAPEGCLPGKAIAKRYAETEPLLELSELAHIVSCPRCLEITNGVLGLKTLAERFPPDTVDRDGGGTGNSGVKPNSEKLKQRVRQVHEHRPRKLRIAVDGHIVATQRISSARSELEAQLKPLATPAFIEVFSEQGLRLAYLQIEEAAAIELEPIATLVEFSDHRYLEVKLTFPGGTPSVKAIYYDPVMDEVATGAEMPVVGSEEASKNSRRSLFGRAKDVLETMLRPWLPSFESPWPLGIAMGAAALVLAFTLSFLMKTPPAPHGVPAANALLAKSHAFEEASIGRGGAIHRTFALETLSEQGAVLASRTVDSWRSISPNRSATRVLDAKGKLIGGEWQDAKGNITRYPRQSIGPADEGRTIDPPANFNDSWRSIAQDLLNSWLAQVNEQVHVSQEADGFDLHYEPASEDSAPGLVRADLVVTRDSAELVRGVYTIREGTHTEKHRFRRLSSDIVPASGVVDQDFLPELGPRSAGAAMLPGTSVNDYAHWMLAALKLTDQLNPSLAESIDISTKDDKSIEVDGVLPSTADVGTLTEEFRGLLDSNRLVFNLHSHDQATTESQTTQVSIASSAPIELDRSRVPLDSEFRSAFQSKGLSGTDLESAIVNAANKGILLGNRACRAAFKLHEIAAVDFSPDDLRQLSQADRTLWLNLLSQKANAVQAELAQLHDVLGPIELDQNTPRLNIPSSLPLIDNAERLGAASTELNENCNLMSQLLTEDLTISAENSSKHVTAVELNNLVLHTQKLSERITSTLAVLSR